MEKNSSLVFINQEIHSSKDDHIGMSSYVESINEAIDAGASMIGITADYGAGKSSLVELLVEQDKEKNKSFIKVNMWDSKTSKEKVTEKETDAISFLEKSFLYQVALKSNQPHLAKHVNKRLNGNNGLISFTSPKKSIWLYFFMAVILLVSGILIHSFNFDIKIGEFVFTNFIYNICYVCMYCFKRSIDQHFIGGFCGT